MVLEIFLFISSAFFSYYIFQLLLDEAIFVPLPKKTIIKMLRLARVKKNDLIYDLGSGDGRVLIIAAKEFGCKCVGIEKSYLLYLISKLKIKREKLEKNIRVIHGNFFDFKLKNASVVFMYLSKKIVNKLKTKLERELKNCRVVSADHRIEGWKIDKKIKTGHFYSYLYRLK